MSGDLFRHAVCLAPMVRAGTLPLRLLAMRYGADLVYGEEIVDKRIIATKRVENPVLQTVDYISSDGRSIVFRTCAEEKSKVVFQIGTAEPSLALEAAKHVERDVAAIDINMGCPKHFSVQGGMGTALLKKQDVACEIIRTLRQNLSVPVSCKIRLLESADATIDFMHRLSDAGAVAIGLHARHANESPSDVAHWEDLAPIVAAATVPVLVNGDIFVRDDIERLRKLSGALSFLIARGALSNCSIFSPDKRLDPTEVAKEYLRVAADTDTVFPNVKYNLSRMLPTKCDPEAKDKVVTVAELCKAKNNEEMYGLWDLAIYYKECQARFQARANELHVDLLGNYESDQKYDDAHVENRQFYCNVCNLQLLSDKDVQLHIKGKKHKRNVRSTTGRTVSEQIGSAAVTKQQSHQNGEATEQNNNDATEQHRVKRIKLDESAIDPSTNQANTSSPPASSS